MKGRTLLTLIFLFSGAVPSAAPAATADKPGEIAPAAIKETYITEPVFGGRLYMVEAGRNNAQTILLVHGIGDEGTRNWEKLIPALAPHYHVIAFDLPGFGLSEKGNHLYSPQNYASLVKWLADNYAHGPVILLGHSLGGAVALRFAADYPESVSRLVLVSVAGILHRSAMTRYMSSFRPKRGWQELFSGSFKVLNDAVDNAFDRLEADGLPVDLSRLLSNAFLRKVLFQSSPRTIAALALLQEDFGPALDSVKTPTNIIWGEDDRVAPLRTARILAAKIPGSQIDIIGGAGHVLVVHKSSLFNRVLLEALSHLPVNSEYPKLLPPPGGKRNGFCDGGSGTLFSGPYKRIEIKGCAKVRLDGVSASELYISGSELSIENSLVKSSGTAITVKDSKVEATNVTIEGDTAIESLNSSLDIAGTTIIAGKYALKTTNVSSVLFSVSHISSLLSSGYIHGRYVVTPDSPL
ncbi:MAG: alpha/beta hydrolase [bacterium]|nr:alpha/beta hydrolase [bacterium]